jgi:hypothetical protein
MKYVVEAVWMTHAQVVIDAENEDAAVNAVEHTHIPELDGEYISDTFRVISVHHVS